MECREYVLGGDADPLGDEPKGAASPSIGPLVDNGDGSSHMVHGRMLPEVGDDEDNVVGER